MQRYSYKGTIYTLYMGVRLNRRELNGHMEDWLFQYEVLLIQVNLIHVQSCFNTTYITSIPTNIYCSKFYYTIWSVSVSWLYSPLTWMIRLHFITCCPGVKPLNLSFIWNGLKFLLSLMFIILNIFFCCF